MKAAAVIIFNPEQFSQLTSSEIAAYIRGNENTAIVGEKIGIDRHIIRYGSSEAWFNYKNPHK